MIDKNTAKAQIDAINNILNIKLSESYRLVVKNLRL